MLGVFSELFWVSWGDLQESSHSQKKERKKKEKVMLLNILHFERPLQLIAMTEGRAAALRSPAAFFRQCKSA